MDKSVTNIHVELLDEPDLPEKIRGKSFDCSSTTHMCQADRYAFERYFKLGGGVLVGLSDLFVEKTDAAGKPVLDGKGDPKVVVAEGRDGGEFHELHLGFFGWRALRREIPELASVSFELFSESVAELVVKDEDTKDDERVDPTAKTTTEIPQPA